MPVLFPGLIGDEPRKEVSKNVEESVRERGKRVEIWTKSSISITLISGWLETPTPCDNNNVPCFGSWRLSLRSDLLSGPLSPRDERLRGSRFCQLQRSYTQLSLVLSSSNCIRGAPCSIGIVCLVWMELMIGRTGACKTGSCTL